jgi:hypothetical protein
VFFLAIFVRTSPPYDGPDAATSAAFPRALVRLFPWFLGHYPRSRASFPGVFLGFCAPRRGQIDILINQFTLNTVDRLLNNYKTLHQCVLNKD